MQLTESASSVFMSLHRSLIICPFMHTMGSSKHIIDLLLFRHKGKSFVYKIKKTPYVISRGSEVLLLQLTYRFLFVR